MTDLEKNSESCASEKSDSEQSNFILSSRVGIEDYRKERLADITNIMQSIQPEEFERFLSEKGCSNKCLSCGSKKLLLPRLKLIRQVAKNIETDNEKSELSYEVDEITTEFIAYSIVSDDNVPNLKNVEYKLKCSHCGFVANYNVKPFLEWREVKGM